jgi:hypothetical protein
MKKIMAALVLISMALAVTLLPVNTTTEKETAQPMSVVDPGGGR